MLTKPQNTALLVEGHDFRSLGPSRATLFQGLFVARTHFVTDHGPCQPSFQISGNNTQDTAHPLDALKPESESKEISPTLSYDIPNA